MRADPMAQLSNRLKAEWAQGRPTLNGWLSIPSAFGAEIVAAQGYDSLTIDMQHGMVGHGDLIPMLQGIRASGVAALVRVPWLEPGIVMKALDAGAVGIICPMINTRAQAEELVSMTRYPPDGARSSGPTRALFVHGADYTARANGEVLVLAMIETAQALGNLAEILATPGLDGVYVGPSDLSISLSNGVLPHGMDRQEPEMIARIRSIADAARGGGKRCGLHCGSAAYAAQAVGWGFDMVTVSSDVRLLSSAAAEIVGATRRLLAGKA